MGQDVFEYVVYRLSGKLISDYYRKVSAYQLRKILRDFDNNHKKYTVKDWNEVLRYFQTEDEEIHDFKTEEEFHKWLTKEL